MLHFIYRNVSSLSAHHFLGRCVGWLLIFSWSTVALSSQPSSFNNAMTNDNTTTHPRVALVTSAGTIVLELYPEKAPETVKNFLHYVETGFYNETIFHRVIEGFMIQGGGHEVSMAPKAPTQKPIQNEADNGLSNKVGAIAMARTNDPHSASSQFFINVNDNSFLNFQSKTSAQGWGYAVFGQVVGGMDIVHTIEKMPTAHQAGHQDVPKEAVVITEAKVL